MIVMVALLCIFLPMNYGEYDYWPNHWSPSKLGKFKNAAISTDTAPCGPIGRDILQRNGSAVDCAIAVLLCMEANNFQSQGLGGGFLMLYYNRTKQKVYYMDSREVAPRKATADMLKRKNYTASRSIAVPGELAGFWKAHQKFGLLPWKELFTPTIKMLKDGIVVSDHLASALKNGQRDIMRFDILRNAVLKNGKDVYKAGERIKRPRLAETMDQISKLGPRALYGNCKLARNFLADLKAAGSIIDRVDMKRYSPRMRKPTRVPLRGNTTLYSASIPGSGALLSFMLMVLDGYSEYDNTASVADNEEATTLFYHRMAEIIKYSLPPRSRLGDLNSKKVLQVQSNLTSKAYADYVRSLIDDSKTYKFSHYGDRLELTKDHGTTHLSLVASNGDAVCVTSTINNIFGSHIMSNSTGILLNDQMKDFSTNYNKIRPGKRPLSSASPSVLIDDQGDVKLAIGAAGGYFITPALLQVMARVLFLGQDIKTSIDAPRFYQWTSEYLHEKTFPMVLLKNLMKRRHNPKIASSGSLVNGIHRDQDGRLCASYDFRKAGSVDGF